MYDKVSMLTAGGGYVGYHYKIISTFLYVGRFS